MLSDLGRLNRQEEMNAVDPETGTAGVVFERDKPKHSSGLPQQQTSVDQA